MKTRIGLGILALALTVAGARGASLYTESFNLSNTFIPDGNPVGLLSQGTVSDIPGDLVIQDLTVSLNLSGGYDGNLYAYLVAPNGTLVQLLDQPGDTLFGNPSPGMNLTLADGAPAITSGMDLTIAGNDYAAAGTLAGLDGSAPDGTWNLFFADVASGGGTSELNNWTLNITAVPEPRGGALALLAGLAGLWRLRRKTIPAEVKTK